MITQLQEITNYQTLVFDCDGVVLNSNKIKTQAFYEATKHFGHEPAQALVDYHVQNGGISRYAKFEYFITQILKQELDESLNQDLLHRFAQAVKDGLMNCEAAAGLKELRAKTKHANWLIVSGGDQAELREVFAARGLDKFFDGGIFGSPDTKDTILEREMKNNNIKPNALFLGDSKYDYSAASKAVLDFVFLSNWTEMNNWRNFISENNIHSLPDLNKLNSKNILLVINNFNQGGAEIGLFNLLIEVKNRGNLNIEIFTLFENQDNELTAKYNKYFNVYQNIKNESIYQRTKNLHKLISNKKFSSLISSLPQATVVARLIKIFHPKLNLITFEHSIAYRRKTAYFLIKYTDFLTNSFMVDSKIVNKTISHRIDSKKKVVEIPLFFYAKQKYGNPANATTKPANPKLVRLVAASRLDLNQKRIDILIQAISKMDLVELHIYGEGPDEAKIKTLVKKNKQNTKIIFHGFKSDWYKDLFQYDAFIAISDREGLAITVLEAMSSNIIVIASTVGEIPNYIIHQHNGLLIQKNTVDEIMLNIEWLRKNQDQSETIKMNALKTVQEKYSLDKIASNFEQSVLR